MNQSKLNGACNLTSQCRTDLGLSCDITSKCTCSAGYYWSSTNSMCGNYLNFSTINFIAAFKNTKFSLNSCCSCCKSGL